jgi:serine/threonine protein kinase
MTLSLRTKLFILAGIISGIDFIHSKEIVHLDIKLGNILI